jgi:hypothetical protein
MNEYLKKFITKKQEKSNEIDNYVDKEYTNNHI